LSVGLGGTHFSNGNTSWRNAGLNSAGINLGVDYTINPLPSSTHDCDALEDEADKKIWIYDIMMFGAWRQRLLWLGDPETERILPK
ncbi:MAG: acyloxyacyl hydrolase, partial [Muribaculaceae bacterium]|nr:acyloxyacyl hydrolase [Muribaculaceae bacterium]